MNPPPPRFTLVSHALCPYVQRAAIVLAEKAVPFQRREVDLAAKPDWFLAISPLGKTPVLLVDETPLFESAVICEYLEDTLAPRLHPADALQRARHRGWMEFGSVLLAAMAAFYSAPDETQLRSRADTIQGRLAQLEAALGAGPYFAGPDFSLVDAVFGPVLRYFPVIDSIRGFRWFEGLPKVAAWAAHLAARPSVAAAVAPDYPQRLRAFLLERALKAASG